MELRRLGESGLKVSEIGLGCNNFGMRIEQPEAEAVVGAALDAGINFFDTADVYGGGRSEEMLGKGLGARRKDVIVATKFALPMGKSPYDRGGSRLYVMRAAEASLKRLGTDYIDLYQMHAPDPETPIEETLRALDDLMTQGKVLYVGNSNFAGWQIADADWTARTQHFSRFVSAQNHYNLLERDAGTEAVRASRRFGLGMLPYFPLASGMLSGKYHRGEAPPEGTRMAGPGPYGERMLTEAHFDRIERLTAWARERGHSLLELAFAWLLGHPEIASVIAGATKPDQARANAAAAGWKLTPEEVKELRKLAG
ncbi:MAG: aldo/keto reductase [Caulobacteraceae bacterium]|nr:aldo/keto reductase [Caulobacteraceae bacterium]